MSRSKFGAGVALVHLYRLQPERLSNPENVDKGIFLKKLKKSTVKRILLGKKKRLLNTPIQDLKAATNFFGYAHPDILTEIFMHLGIQSLIKVAGVCKKWRQVAVSQKMLENVQRKYGNAMLLLSSKPMTISKWGDCVAVINQRGTLARGEAFDTLLILDYPTFQSFWQDKDYIKKQLEFCRVHESITFFTKGILSAAPIEIALEMLKEYIIPMGQMPMVVVLVELKNNEFLTSYQRGPANAEDLVYLLTLFTELVPRILPSVNPYWNGHIGDVFTITCAISRNFSHVSTNLKVAILKFLIVASKSPQKVRFSTLQTQIPPDSLSALSEVFLVIF